MSEIRVAHVTTVASSLHYLLLNQLATLRRHGFVVWGVSAPGADSAALTAAGLPHVAIPMSRNLAPFVDLVALWRLYWLFKRERFAIVHTHTPKAGLLGQLAARLAGVPVVVNTLHGFYFHDAMSPRARRFYIAMERIAARCSSAILSQNEEDIRTAVREGICSPGMITHLGNGIDLVRFDRRRIPNDLIAAKRAALGLPAEARIVGFVGRLAARRKGFTTFLSAARDIAARYPEARFLIVGEADRGKPDAVEPTAAADYGIADRCLFLGQRPNDELPLLYCLMDVLVLPSLFEGLPRAIMEASAMGVPVVATDVKGNREAIDPARSGLLVPLGDTTALVDALAALLSDPERRLRLGHGGRQVAEERFDERRVFATVIAEYTRLLAAAGIPSQVPVMLDSDLA